MKTSRVFQAFCGLILLLLISGANTRAFASPTYALSVSTSASRGNGAALQGAALSGSVYIFTSNATSLQNYNPTGINKVCYWLDNTAMSGTATHCESVSPYDFVGTAADGSAEPWDTSKISAGSHSITQSVTRSNGGKEVDSATFTVDSTTLPPPPAAGSTVVFRNLNSNLCIDTGGSSTFTALVQSACSSSSSQQFKLNSSPTTGWYYLAGATPNLCWDIAGGSLSAGAIIQQYTCTAVSPEYFQLKAVAGGYQILPKNLANGCVDIVGASTSSGAQIEQNTCNGSANQNFQVSVISGSAPVAPSISTQPASQTVAAGQSATFSVAATGTAPMSYQWQKNGAAISGATSSTYATPATTSSDNGAKFAALVSNSAGSVTSTAATLTVNTAAPPSVSISSPSNGATVSGSITVSGTASDSVGLSSVQVQVDSGTFSSASGTSNWSFSLNTSSLSNSSHIITARATDTSGNSASSSVSVSVSNGTGGPSINVKNYGATGNGSTDDTAAINSAIAALSSGATLLFPCGTYLTSAQLTLNLSNVTVDGSSCATIHNTSSGTVFSIGGSGNGNPNYGSPVALSSTANELATSFSTVSSLGLAPGDLLRLQQGGQDSSTGSGNTGCDDIGCRGELLKVASVSGNSITVSTALHDTYNPSLNAATAQKLLGPLSAITVKNITFDGNGSNVYGLAIAGVADSSISGVTVRNVQGSALLNRGDFNISWSNITVTQAGSAQCGSSAWFENQSNLSINGLSISNENQGASGSGCLYNGAFGFELIGSANNTITNLTVDGAGAYGRPMKLGASRWNTLNSITAKNGVAAMNGLVLHYYSSHNTFNNCVITNNGAGTGTGTGNAGINLFGNFNQYNSFNNCTVSGNGNVQFYISSYDALRLAQDSHNTINGGTFTGSNSSVPVILIEGDGTYITGATINGPGPQGIDLDNYAPNACVNNNTFTGGTNLGAAISASGTNDVGLGNLLNLLSSNLSVGTCAPPLP